MMKTTVPNELNALPHATAAPADPNKRMTDLFLIVDDDLPFANAIARLMRGGREWRVATTARAAFDVLSTDRPCALIVDVKLPDASGLDVAEHARRLTPPIPVLVITGEDSDDISRRCLRMGARYAKKPVQKPELDAFVLDALASMALGHDAAAIALQDFARHCQLSRRELEVLACAVRQVSIDQTCRELGIGTEGYKSIVGRLLDRVRGSGFNVRTTTEVANIVLRWTVFGPDAHAR